MIELPPTADNPYQSPADAAEPLTSTHTDDAVLKRLKDFRTQIHALGAVWIILGGLAWVTGLFAAAMFGEGPNGWLDAAIVIAIVGGLGTVWIVLGIFACWKQMWAVYTGLVLSYIVLAGNLVRFNVCALAIVWLIIVQAHRVIRWAKQVKATGISLTTKPHDLQSPGNF